MSGSHTPSWWTALALLAVGWVVGWALGADPVAALYAEEVARFQTLARGEGGERVKVELIPLRGEGAGEVWRSGMPVALLEAPLTLEMDPDDVLQVDARPFGEGMVKVVAQYGRERREAVLETRGGLMTWWWEKGP
ncbi:MAG: hypothetical protein KM310_02185 [Clostridiales bacterium]|nr:hypothetical protein [Clostridiales bacterium]